MNKLTPTMSDHSPALAIGGVGGSGTRLVALLVKRLGFYLGGELNPQQDNLWFSLLFRRESVLQDSDAHFALLFDLFKRKMLGNNEFTRVETQLVNSLGAVDRTHHDREWLSARVQSFIGDSMSEFDPAHHPWGWKEPNTHIVLDRIWQIEPKLRYIHVIRNGLDMAISNNQNQFALWAKTVFGIDGPVNPRLSLKFWRMAHERMFKIAQSLPHQFLCISYDELCDSPHQELAKLYAFLGANPDNLEQDQLESLIVPNPKRGRFRQIDTGAFDSADIDYVRSLGFAVN